MAMFQHKPGIDRGRRLWLLIRGFAPLAVIGALLLTGPTLLAWWLMGGSFGWPHLLVGGGVSLGLLAALGLIFGWAVGRKLRK